MLALVAEWPALAEPMPCGPVESDSQEAPTDFAVPADPRCFR